MVVILMVIKLGRWTSSLPMKKLSTSLTQHLQITAISVFELIFCYEYQKKTKKSMEMPKANGTAPEYYSSLYFLVYIYAGDHKIKLRPNRNQEKQILPLIEQTDKIAVARSQLSNSPQTIPTYGKDHQKKLLPTKEEQSMPVPQQVPNVCSAPKFPKKTISKGGGQCNSKHEEKKFHVIDQVQKQHDEDKQLVVALQSSKKLCGKEEKKLLRVVNLEAAQTNGGGDHHEGNLCFAAAKSQKKSIQNKISVGSKHKKFPLIGVKRLGAEIESSKKTFCPSPQEKKQPASLNEKKQPTCLTEAGRERKLEASKRKLEQGYKQFENGRKRMRIFDLKDLPQQRGVIGCRPVQNYRSSHKLLGCVR